MAGREPADWRDGDGRGVVSVRHVPSDRSTIKIKIRGGEVGMKMVGDRREIEASREEKERARVHRVHVAFVTRFRGVERRWRGKDSARE